MIHTLNYDTNNNILNYFRYQKLLNYPETRSSRFDYIAIKLYMYLQSFNTRVKSTVTYDVTGTVRPARGARASKYILPFKSYVYTS